MSLHKRERDLRSTKFAKKRKKKIIGLIIIIFLLLLLILGLAIFILNLPFLQIKDVEIVGATKAPSVSIREKTLSELQGRQWGLVPKSSIFFYPRQDIVKALRSSFTEISDLDIKTNLFSKITVTVKERQKTAIVCAGFRDDADDNNCYFSDEHGYIFEKTSTTTQIDELAGNLSGNSLRQNLSRYYVPVQAGELSPGKNFLSENKFRDFQNFWNGAAKVGLIPLGVLLSDSGDYEMYVRPDTTIYFDDRSPFATTLSNLQIFWQNAMAKSKATTTPSFDYINLRFGNTIYYSKQ